MKNILDYLYAHKTFSKEEDKEVLENIALGKYNSSQIASFLTVFIMRNITLDELIGFREALLSLCHKVDLSAYNPMDVCGTGGDGKNTFNISNICQASVNATHNVDDKKNFSPCVLSPFFHLLTPDNTGFQNIGFKFRNMLVSK
jgi:anthranilate phosphoribosyltransferase